MEPRPQAECLNIDTYCEILLRLPPNEPKTLLRFAAVCSGWCNLLRDASFLRRYREFHGLPPVYGYFVKRVSHGFLVTVSGRRPRLPNNDGRHLHALDSRHGRVLFHKFGEDHSLLVVGKKTEEVTLPENLSFGENNWTATVFCDSPGCPHLRCNGGPFTVALLHADLGVISILVYGSATGAWTGAAAMTAPNNADARVEKRPATLAGKTILFTISDTRILAYELGAEAEEHARLRLIQTPPLLKDNRGTAIVPVADGRKVCLACMRDALCIELWEREVRAGAGADWSDCGVVALPREGLRLLGFSEIPAALFISPEKTGSLGMMDVETREWEEFFMPFDTDAPISIIMAFRRNQKSRTEMRSTDELRFPGRRQKQ